VTAAGKNHGTPTQASESESTSGIHELGTKSTTPNSETHASRTFPSPQLPCKLRRECLVESGIEYGLLFAEPSDFPPHLVLGPPLSYPFAYTPTCFAFLKPRTPDPRHIPTRRRQALLRCARRKQSAEIATIAGEEDKRSGRGGGGRPRGCWRERERDLRSTNHTLDSASQIVEGRRRLAKATCLDVPHPHQLSTGLSSCAASKKAHTTCSLPLPTHCQGLAQPYRRRIGAD
jgi:hypothetical protein